MCVIVIVAAHCAAPHRAGQGVVAGEALENLTQNGAEGGPAPAWLQAKDPTAGGGHPDGAPAVITVGQGHQPGCHYCSRAAAGTACSSAQIPRIVGRAKQGRFSHRLQAVLRDVGFAGYNQSGGFMSPDQLAILVWHVVLVKAAAAAEGHSGVGHHQILEQKGYALGGLYQFPRCDFLLTHPLCQPKAVVLVILIEGIPRCNRLQENEAPWGARHQSCVSLSANTQTGCSGS